MGSTPTILLSTAYLPNIQYVSKFFSGFRIHIEQHENYQKQSFRNRTVICGANGPLDLVIPVKRPKGNSTPTREILLDYDTPWMQVHWKAIVSAYKNSPFFEIFEPEIRPLYRRKLKSLFEWNTLLLECLFSMAGIECPLSFTDRYESGEGENIFDFREAIHPKKRMQEADPFFQPSPYYQVFSDRSGCIPNLSFIDLLFNEGPQAIAICRRHFRRMDPS